MFEEFWLASMFDSNEQAGVCAGHSLQQCASGDCAGKLHACPGRHRGSWLQMNDAMGGDSAVGREKCEVCQL